MHFKSGPLFTKTQSYGYRNPVINLRRSRFIMGSPTSQWRHNERDGVSNHQLHGCLFDRSFRRKSKKTSKLRVTGLCVVNSPHKGPNAENVYIWWRRHDTNKRPRNAIYCRYNTVQYNTLLSYPSCKIDMLGLEELFLNIVNLHTHGQMQEQHCLIICLWHTLFLIDFMICFTFLFYGTSHVNSVCIVWQEQHSMENDVTYGI